MDDSSSRPPSGGTGWSVRPRARTTAVISSTPAAAEARQAEADIEQQIGALEAQPESSAAARAELWLQLGELREHVLEDRDGAIAAYEQAVDIDTQAATIEALARVYEQRGREGDAEEAADLHCMLGEIREGEQGIAHFERALDLQPDHATALELLEARLPEEHRHARLEPRWEARDRASDASATRPHKVASPTPAQDLAGASSVHAIDKRPDKISTLMPPCPSEDQPRAKRRGWLDFAWVAVALVFALAMGTYGGRGTDAPNEDSSSAPTVRRHAASAPPASSPTAVTSKVSPSPQLGEPAEPANADGVASVATVEAEAASTHPEPVRLLPEVTEVREGHLDLRQLQSSMNEATARIAKCYGEQVPAAELRTPWRLWISMSVRSDGEVTSLRHRGEPFKDAHAARCVRRALSQTQMPIPERGERAKVRTAFLFTPTP